MDGATAMDGNFRRNRATAMTAMEDGRWRGDGDENDNNQLATGRWTARQQRNGDGNGQRDGDAKGATAMEPCVE